MRIIGIDPGGHTGAAVFEKAWDENYNEIAYELMWHDEIADGMEGLKDPKLLEILEGNVLVCESFRLDGRTPNPELSPERIRGFLEGWNYCHSEEHGNGFQFWREIAYVQPSAHKSLITNEVLKRAGYYPKRGEVRGGHSTDAIRIALWYIVTVLKHRPTIEACWPRDDSGES